MGDRAMDWVCNLRRLPRCGHIKGSSCRCNAGGILPQGENAVPVKQNPEFTLDELIEQVRVPVTTICVDNYVTRAQLRRHCNKIIKKARKEAKEFIGKKPILPQQNSVACIDFFGKDHGGEIEKYCFDMRSLYCRGVLVRGRHFYELRVSGDPTVFVKGSIPLQCKETYDKMLGSQNPRVDLSPCDFSRGYESFLRLDPGQRNHFSNAARSIGLISLMLLEPSRQKYMMDKMCCGEPEPEVYFKMDRLAWKKVHGWGSKSKKAKGIEYENKETVIEKVYPAERWSALEELNIINSTKLLPVKRLQSAQAQIFFSLSEEDGKDDKREE